MTLTKPKTHRLSSNQRKRLGQHHRQQSRHYSKPYWPYLPVFAVLIGGTIFNTMANRNHHSVLGYSTDISPKALLQQTNGVRVSYHEPALQLNPDLTAAAQAKANDMVKRNYWNHLTPDGKQPWTFIVTTGYQYEAAGENLAYGFGSSDQVMTAWMDSKEHRANILDADYQDVGFATADAPNYMGTGPGTVIVAMYGEPTGMISHSTGGFTSKPVPLGAYTKQVTRLQLIDSTYWAALAVAVAAGSVLTLYFIRHALAWHRVLVRGEHFFVRHPLLDVLLMSAAVFCLLLSQIAGTIL